MAPVVAQILETYETAYRETGQEQPLMVIAR